MEVSISASVALRARSYLVWAPGCRSAERTSEDAGEAAVSCSAICHFTRVSHQRPIGKRGTLTWRCAICPVQRACVADRMCCPGRPVLHSGRCSWPRDTRSCRKSWTSSALVASPMLRRIVLLTPRFHAGKGHVQRREQGSVAHGSSAFPFLVCAL